jgi:hypothetical protein
MKKYVAICGMLAALVWVGVAAADTAQGKLTGSAFLPSYGYQFTITSPILDGGDSYVGLENDKSGNCNGDSGEVSFGGFVEPIACAHYVASSRDGSGPKMRFAVVSPFDSRCYSVWRISDGGATDKVGATSLCGMAGGGGADTLAQAKVIVDLGRIGAGSGWGDWQYQTVNGYTITASQT